MRHIAKRRLLVPSVIAALILGAAAAGAAVDRGRDLLFAPPTGLSPAELATWNRLSADEVAIRATARSTARELAKRANAELTRPDGDLRALARETEANADRLTQQVRSLRERKLAFYDSLSGAQQEQVRERLLARIDRMQRLGRIVEAAVSEH
jgi:cell division septum initiation protein DivIVA